MATGSLAFSAVSRDRLYAAATVASVAFVALLVAVRSIRGLKKPKILQPWIPSPRDTLIPHISSAEATALPYPPDLLPGARDVATPYGTMRVYEWGREEGKKVVVVHGDTTPAPMLGPIAEALVRRGCRVILFDLWGRGYSDTPLGVPHDSKLFGMQILFATASSPISWAGSEAFSIIAFSLGAGITMSFASYFPYLVDSIILLAPGGILRYLPKEYKNPCFRFPHLVPYRYLKRLVGDLLGVSLSPRPLNSSNSNSGDKTGAEVPQAAKSVEKGTINVPAIVQWQFDHHRGFVHSFVNTIEYGPLMHQHSDWERICNVIKGKTDQSSSRSRLFNGKILVIFGETDGIVVEKDVAADLLEMIGGPEHVTFKSVPGGHGFPVPSCDEVVQYVSEFWDLHTED